MNNNVFKLKSVVAYTFYVLGGVTIFAGFLVAGYLSKVEVDGIYNSYSTTDWGVFVTYAVSFGTSGLFFIALAEIISYLEKIFFQLGGVLEVKEDQDNLDSKQAN